MRDGGKGDGENKGLYLFSLELWGFLSNTKLDITRKHTHTHTGFRVAGNRSASFHPLRGDSLNVPGGILLDRKSVV